MGRAVKARRARAAVPAGPLQTVQLEELDYLRLATLRGKVHEAAMQGNAEVQQAQGLAQQRVQGAEKAMSDALRKLAPKYGLSLTATYAFDDKRHRLVPRQ